MSESEIKKKKSDFWRFHSIILSPVMNMDSFSRWHICSEYMLKLVVLL